MQLTLTLTVAATIERSVMDISIKAPLPQLADYCLDLPFCEMRSFNPKAESCKHRS